MIHNFDPTGQPEKKKKKNNNNKTTKSHSRVIPGRG